MLVLVVIHGFNGLRYIVNDYAHNKIVNRGLRLAVLAAVVGLLVVGGAAILSTVPSTTSQIINGVNPE